MLCCKHRTAALQPSKASTPTEKNMAESPTKKAKKEHTPETITATSIWDGLRVAAEGKEQSLIGALDEDCELGWLEDEREESVAHFARKPWLAAMLHDSERNRAYARAISKAAEAAPEGCVALEIGAGTGLLTQLLCKENRIGHIVACEMEPALAKIAETFVRAGGFEEDRCTIVNARSDAITLPTPASLVVGDSAQIKCRGAHLDGVVTARFAHRFASSRTTACWVRACCRRCARSSRAALPPKTLS